MNCSVRSNRYSGRHSPPTRACMTYPDPSIGCSRNGSCGVVCSTSGSSVSTPVSVSPPNPTSTRCGPSGRSTLQQHVAARRGRRVGRAAPQDPGREARGGVAERVEGAAQQQVLFEAPAAAAAVYELRGEVIRVEAHLAAGERVEVLERDGPRVAGDDAPQRRQVRPGHLGPADPVQVGGQADVGPGVGRMGGTHAAILPEIRLGEELLLAALGEAGGVGMSASRYPAVIRRLLDAAIAGLLNDLYACCPSQPLLQA